MLAQPAELVARRGEVAGCAEEEGEEWGVGACGCYQGRGEAGHGCASGWCVCGRGWCGMSVWVMGRNGCGEWWGGIEESIVYDGE